MNHPFPTDPRFKRLGLKLGLFLGLGLILGLVLLLGMAERQGYFSPKTPVFFIADSGTDLRPGMAVKLSGFKIGTVRRVDLNESARVDVEMAIEDRYMRWIKRDSMATLAREGMIGDSFISLTRGTPELPALTAKDRLHFELGRGLADIAQDVRNRVVPVIDEMHVLLKYANDPKGDVRQGFAHLNQLAVELRETRRKVDTALTSIDRLSREDAPATLAATRQTLERADASLRELETAIPALQAETTRTLQSLNDTASTATRTAAETERLLKDTAPKLVRVLGETEALMRDSRSAINAARTHWPFKGPDAAPVAVPMETTEPATPTR